MELYHIHLLGNHDKMYKLNNVIKIDKKIFKNRLYDRAMNSNFAVESADYPETVIAMNLLHSMLRYDPVGKKINLDNVISAFLANNTNDDKIKMLRDAKEIIFNASQAKRELSMESYRKDNTPDKPSRMHSLFACSETGVEFWKSALGSSEYDIFRIDVFDEPFVTNEQLLPPEESSYLESYNQSMRYFNPRQKDLNGLNDEYLVQGKVKILEKVDQNRKK